MTAFFIFCILSVFRSKQYTMSTLFKRFRENSAKSGPAWIQAAVTLGGGTLVSALYLGVIGGLSFLWLLPLSMITGVIMLMALSHLTLSQSNEEDRPFRLVIKHIGSGLAWSWLIATMLANIVFCASQFALATDAIQGNLGRNNWNPFLICFILACLVLYLVSLYAKGGKAYLRIQNVIKFLVATIVISFMVVVVILIAQGDLNFIGILEGFVPKFKMLFQPANEFQLLLNETSVATDYWTNHIVSNQRNVIIGAFGTAVGINMTFLLPYTYYRKKWKKGERSLARFDLIIGLLIPFILTASCLVMASASQFHANKDGRVSETAYLEVLEKKQNYDKTNQLSPNAATIKRDQMFAKMLAKRSSHDLAESLRPLLGKWSQLIFGIGILAMAISTMMVHMIINGYALSESIGKPGNHKWFIFGAVLPALSGALSPIIWQGSVKAAIVIPASVIATTLLPIAYLAFFLLMNSKNIEGVSDIRKRRWINFALIFALAISYFAACWALIGKLSETNAYQNYFGIFGLVLLAALSIIGIMGFYKKQKVT